MADYPFPWKGLGNVQTIRYLGMSLAPRWVYSIHKVSLLIETSILQVSGLSGPQEISKSLTNISYHSEQMLSVYVENKVVVIEIIADFLLRLQYCRLVHNGDFKTRSEG